MATAIAVVVIGVVALLYSLSDKAPSLESLRVVSGALHSYEEARTGTRTSSKTPRFKLEGSDKLFQYVSKGGKLGAVSSALKEAAGKVVEVYVDEANPFSPPLKDIEIYTVYAVSIEGVAIREYGEVAAAWNSDSKIGVFVGAFFILAGLSVGIIVVRDRLRSE